jgi:hypothetical protein
MVGLCCQDLSGKVKAADLLLWIYRKVTKWPGTVLNLNILKNVEEFAV